MTSRHSHVTGKARKWTRAQTIANARQCAIQAARSGLRELAIAPEASNVDTAWGMLNHLSKTEPQTLSSEWFLVYSSEGNQEKLFRQEWERWCRVYKARQVEHKGRI